VSVQQIEAIVQRIAEQHEPEKYTGNETRYQLKFDIKILAGGVEHKLAMGTLLNVGGWVPGWLAAFDKVSSPRFFIAIPHISSIRVESSKKRD
jgi:hypothetical protein